MTNLQKLGVLVVVLIVATIVYNLLVNGFEPPESLENILYGVAMGGVIVTALALFVPGSAGKTAIGVVITCIAFITIWSVVYTTNPVAAGGLQDSAGSALTTLSNMARPANAYNDTVTLQADRDCDRLTAEGRAKAEKQSADQFGEDGHLDNYIARREAIQKEWDVTKKCKTTSPTAPTPAPADTSSSTAPSTANANTKRFVINANVPFVDTGIDVTKQVVSIRVVGSDCWHNGGQQPTKQCGEGLGPYPGTVLANAPIGALIAKTSSGYTHVGKSGTIQNQRGNLQLGMNELLGKSADNGGSLTVEVTVQ